VSPGSAIPSLAPFAVLQGVGDPVHMLRLVLSTAVVRSRVMPRWTEVTDSHGSYFPVASSAEGARPHRPADRATAQTRGGGHGIHALRTRGRAAYEHPGGSGNSVAEE
jgi:hypothetical protein